MRILCTGAGGFIGSHLMDALRGQHTVLGLDNYLTGTQYAPDIIEADITERRPFYATANLVEPDLVIHCAASYNDPMLWHRDTDTNVAGAINVAAVARHHNARIIYFQTILPPISSYAISKIAGEQYLRISGQPLTVFRLANVYGPRNVSGPIPVFYKRVSTGQPCVAVETTRDMIFIEDVVECVLEAIEREETGTFDVCTGKQVTIAEIFYRVTEALGSSAVARRLPPGPDDVQGEISIRNRLPGWEATTPLRDGIARAVAYYRAEGVEQTHTHLKLEGHE